MADTKLKPCPFCGSKNVEIFKPVNSVHIGKIGRAIICNDCDVRISFPQAYDDVHAAEFWNDRKFEAERKRHGEWIKTEMQGKNRRRIKYHIATCSVCEKCNGRKLSAYCPNCGAKMDGGDRHDN